MNRRTLRLVVLVVLAVAIPASVAAQERDLSRTIRQTGIHRYAGYASIASLATTAVLGVAGVESVHPVLGITTIGLAATAEVLGIIAYRDELPRVWPHALLNGLALGGLILNAAVWEPGSVEHRITGMASLLSMAGGYAYIALTY